MSARQIFLDTETTGLSARDGDRIIEIGCIEMVNRRLTGRTLHHYLNPERASHPDALKVHGLTEEFLSDKPKFGAVAADIAAFIEGAELIIHNAEFDVGFLDAEFAREQCPRVAEVAAEITDSLLMARERYPGKSNSLDALCRRLEVDNAHRTLHGALLDASLLAEVYVRMTRGQDSLVIDDGDAATPGSAALGGGERIDLSQIALAVIEPSAEEAALHALQLADLDKASGGKTLWRAAAAP
jgi:DNA polymerase III subunit epsilon